MGAAGAAAAGWLLGWYPEPGAYVLLFCAAGTFEVLSMIIFGFVDDPAEGSDETGVRLRVRELGHHFRTSLGSANFRAFLVGRVLASVGFCMLPFIAVYYKSTEGGGLDKGTVVSSGAAMTLAIALANLVLGRLGDRRGHRIGILVAPIAQAATLAVVLLSSGRWSCVAAYTCAGLAAGSAWISHTNMLFETCPHDHRLAHITVGNLVLSLPMLAAPLLAGVVADLCGMATLFRLCLVLSLAAAAWIALRVREPRHLEAYEGI